MKLKAVLFCTVTLLVASNRTIAEANYLPIYIEDNHAGTFYWLAKTIELDKPCTMILFDAHSDASGIFDSDKLRQALRNIASRQDRQALLDRWRRTGAVQCFNWIEPLMPAPIAKLIWVPSEHLSAPEIVERTQKAIALLDGHLEAAPRESGSLSKSYVVSDFNHLEKHLNPNQPLVVTIDLDYFAGLSVTGQEAAFTRIWNFVIEQRNLRAVTFAISRPYLRDEGEAHRLLNLALTGALSLPTARLEFEPFLAVANDHSTLAKELMAKGEKVPAFDLAQAPQKLRARILAEGQRIVVQYDAARWQQLLHEWSNEAPQLHLQVRNHQPSTDNIWRIPAQDAAEIQLVTEPWTSKLEKIEWFALTPKYLRCNVTDLSSDQVGFVANAAPRPAWNEVLISQNGSVLPLSRIDGLFDRELHCGSLRLRARAVVDGKIRETPVLELRRFIGDGFRAAISEQFGLPYLFGSGELSHDSDTGPEMNLGADCANFVVYALRRQGQRIPWSDPKRLRDKLDLVARSVEPGAAKISPEDLQRGIIVHLGTHVAALMQDRPPVGILDDNDLVAHQLGGVPETVTVGQLLKQRRKSSFDLFRVAAAKPAATLVFGGDVMLGRSCAARIENGSDPFAGIATLLRSASFAAANLECTISNRGKSIQRYAFRAPASSAQLLRRAGFRAMGLANNHADDFGAVALNDCATRLSREQVQPIGIGTPGNNAFTPSVFSVIDGKKIAVLAISDFGSATNLQMATASDRSGLTATICNARAHADFVVCLVHWGVENNENVTGEQRELGRWLIDHGVDLVVGSHPHCVQPLDFYHGRPIAYSLGNLVFDGAPAVTSWNRGALLEVALDKNAGASSVSLIPLVLKDGFPQLRVGTEMNRLGRLQSSLKETSSQSADLRSRENIAP